MVVRILFIYMYISMYVCVYVCVRVCIIFLIYLLLFRMLHYYGVILHALMVSFLHIYIISTKIPCSI
jgi:hypothetical protein